MKTVVILAVLVASLLVVTGSAFASTNCSSYCPNKACYKVTGTELPTGGVSTADWFICFPGPFAAYVCDTVSSVPPILELATFPEGLRFQAISWDSGNHGAYMKFNGSGDIFNGLYYNGTDRFLIHGVQEECP